MQIHKNPEPRRWRRLRGRQRGPQGRQGRLERLREGCARSQGSAGPQAEQKLQHPCGTARRRRGGPRAEEEGRMGRGADVPGDEEGAGFIEGRYSENRGGKEGAISLPDV